VGGSQCWTSDVGETMTYDDVVSCTVMIIDVAGSASHTNPWQLRMRADLRAIVLATLEGCGHDAARLDLDDTGDGVRLIFRSEAVAIGLLARFIPRLAAALQAHRTADPLAGLRLRVAVDAGLLHRDHGWHGTPLILCSRLCDAEVVRRTLRAANRADLVLVVSSRVYDEVVRHGYDGIDPDSYRSINLQVKETSATAWIHVPGYASPPAVGAEEDPTGRTPAEADREDRSRTTMHATLLGDGRVYQAGRDQYISES
jgi:hypothetical protein